MLRLGLLQCDSLDAPHVSVAGDYDVLFTELLTRHDVEVVVYRADQHQLPRSVADCDAWVVPGSRLSVYDDVAWIAELRSFVSDLLATELPVIGICFGHQLIAQVLDAPVAKADVGWNIGAIDYTLHSAPLHPTSEAGSFTLIASHQDQVLALPDGATLLASAETCPVAGYTVGNRVFTVQAHPEFDSPLAASLYRSRVDRIGAEPVARALDSLAKQLDRGRVSDWMINFARGAG